MHVIALRSIEASEEVDDECYLQRVRSVYNLFLLDYDIVYRYDTSEASTTETTSGNVQFYMRLQSLHTPT